MSDVIRWGHCGAPSFEPSQQPKKIPFLNIKEPTEVLLLAPPISVLVHYSHVERVTIPCLVKDCGYCSEYQSKPPYPHFYAPVIAKVLVPNGESQNLKRILSIPEMAAEAFMQPELIGAVLLLDTKVVLRHRRVVIEQSAKKHGAKLPEAFDVRDALRQHWRNPYWPENQANADTSADPPNTVPFPSATDRQTPPARRVSEGGAS
jgi:hypothetical protein